MLSENVKAYAYSRAADAVSVSRQKDVETISVFSEVVGMLLILLIPLLLVYLLRGVNLQTEYEVQNLRSEVVALTKENSVSALTVMQMESPGRIQHIAESELGMSVPEYVISGSCVGSGKVES